jgi:hypothetical protein
MQLNPKAAHGTPPDTASAPVPLASSGAATSPASEAAKAALARAKAYRLHLEEPDPGAAPDPATGRPPTRSLETPALARSEAQSFDRDGRRTRPRFDDKAWRKVLRNAFVTLPEHADERIHLRDDVSSVALTVALEGAQHVRGETADGYVVYPGAAPGGGDIVHLPTVEGTEDHLHYDTRPTVRELRYTVGLAAKVAGLRKVSEVVEFLDEGGAPRLRMNAPYAVDAKGERHELAVRIEGCAYDTDPRAPWGRPTMTPRAEACTVAVTLPESGYPMLVDPAWTATGGISAYRTRAVLSPSGLVCMPLAPSSFIALFDEGTGTWSDGGQVDFPDFSSPFTSTGVLPDGRPVHCFNRCLTYRPSDGGFDQST